MIIQNDIISFLNDEIISFFLCYVPTYAVPRKRVLDVTFCIKSYAAVAYIRYLCFFETFADWHFLHSQKSAFQSNRQADARKLAQNVTFWEKVTKNSLQETMFLYLFPD